MPGMKRSILSFTLILFCALAQIRNGEGSEAGYPSRPVTIIVPFAAGGGMDRSARLVAKYAESELGQRILVVNDTTGGNIQGNRKAIAAAPDGYTLGVWGAGLVTDALIIRNVSYSHRDVYPVCTITEEPESIVVAREYADEHGIKTLEDLFAYVRKRPGMVSAAMGGNWTMHDFLRRKIEIAAGVSFNRMPFLGGYPALTATTEGNSNVAMPLISELLTHPRAGLVIPLAVAYHERLPQLPDIPTLAEAGYPGIVQVAWRVFAAPKNTPPEIVDRLENAFASVFANPEFGEEAMRLGLIPIFKGSVETKQFLLDEHERFSLLINDLGIPK